MSEQELLSDAQACDLARQMANHYRVFEQLHKVLEKVMISSGRVKQLDASIATLLPIEAALKDKVAEAEQTLETRSAEIRATLAELNAEVSTRQLIAAQTDAALVTNHATKIKRLEEAHAALMFQHQQDIEDIMLSRDKLIHTISVLDERKKSLVNEFGALIGG